MNVAVGLLKLLNCDVNVDGPLVTLQAPVPVPGVFAASETLVVVVQMVWFDPAFEVVGAAFTVTLAFPVADPPHQFFTVTEYVPVAAPVTVGLEMVASLNVPVPVQA